MKIHVTGAHGLLGKCATKTLAEIGNVIESDIDTMNICDSQQVESVLGKDPPDVLVHVAAIKGNQPSKDNPVHFYEVNSTGTLHLLEACRKFSIKQFIFVSSISVHGMSQEPIHEDTPIRPQHPYGASKACGEALIHSYVRSYGLNATIVRPNFIVGPIFPPAPYVDNLIYSFLEAIDTHGCIELAGDGSFEREWIHPEDVATVLKLAILQHLNGCHTFILGPNRISMRNLAEGLVLRLGRGEVRTDPTKPGFSLISSSQHVQDSLAWKPAYTFDDIVTQICDEYQARKNHSDYRYQ